MEARKKGLKQTLEAAEEPPPLLHPNMAPHYRAQLDELYVALRGDCEAKRLETAEVIGSLIEAIALERKKPASWAGFLRSAMTGDGSHLLLVAGAGFEPATFRL